MSTKLKNCLFGHVSDHPAKKRCISAARVVENLSQEAGVSSSEQNMPSFTQARDLSVLAPEQQCEIAKRNNSKSLTAFELAQRIKQAKGESRPLRVRYVGGHPHREASRVQRSHAVTTARSRQT
jgi:hypothetical protein